MRSALDLRAVASLIVICGSWGLNQVAIKITLLGMPPAFQLGARSLVAAALVFVWCLIRGKPLFRSDGTLLPGLAAGMLFAAEFLLFFVGLQYTTASRAVVFTSLAPFVVAVGGHLFLSEPLTGRILAGLGCALVGIIVAFSDALAIPTRAMLFGDALCVGAAVFWGLTTVLIKGSALNRALAEKTLLYQLAVSAVVGFALSFAIGELIDTRLAIAVWPAFLYQSIWVAGITYVAWFALVRRYPASLLSSFTFLTPLFGVAFGATLLNEPISPAFLAALFLVAIGINLVNSVPARLAKAA
jgi:drug/metabolite transporter (DMT)-like permease